MRLLQMLGGPVVVASAISCKRVTRTSATTTVACSTQNQFVITLVHVPAAAASPLLGLVWFPFPPTHTYTDGLLGAAAAGVRM